MDIFESTLMKAISFQAVVDSGYPAVIRAAASTLMKHDYLDVGSFLAQLPQTDLDELTLRAARVTVGEDTDLDFDSLILLASMLSQAEGGTLEGPIQARTSNLMILLTFEDLARKDIVEFDREKATLLDDILDQSIARLK